MTRIPTPPDALGEPATSLQPAALNAVRRELRSRRSSASDRWATTRLSEQLPRVALHDALQILLGWRGESRFEAGAVAWHARLAGHAPRLTLEDSGRVLSALGELGSSSPDVGARALRALCQRYRLADAAAVLDEWLAGRKSYGGL